MLKEIAMKMASHILSGISSATKADRQVNVDKTVNGVNYIEVQVKSCSSS